MINNEGHKDGEKKNVNYFSYFFENNFLKTYKSRNLFKSLFC